MSSEYLDMQQNTTTNTNTNNIICRGIFIKIF